MWNVANCNMIGVVVLSDDVDYHSKSGIWNDIDSNHSNCLLVQRSPIYFVFYHGCCWIVTHCLQEPRSWVGIRPIDEELLCEEQRAISQVQHKGEEEGQ